MYGNITIAVPKGRILKGVLSLLAALDIYPREALEATRKLIMETNRPDVKLIIIRAADVPTYVEYGAADLGVAGKDVLLECGSQGIYEPLDLKIAQCRMVIAKPKHLVKEGHMGRKRVATKYVNTARHYFASQGQQVEIIKLYGSMELAPVLGLANQIIDLVDTGNTLRANGLVEIRTITEISARLIINKGAMKMKNEVIKPMIERLEKVVDARWNSAV